MLESFTTDKFEYKRLSNEEQKTRGILGRLVGIIGDTKNATRNGRRYNKELWQKVFDDPIVNEKINNRLMLGEMGHPENREEIDLEKVAICLAEKPKVGKDGALWGVFDIIDTPNGRLLKALCDYGCNIGISSRGTGDIIYDEDGNETVDPDTYVLETYDAVIVPGVEKARLQYVNESLDTKKRNKTLRQKLTEELDKASDGDKKIMEETLKNLDIKLDEGKLVKPSEEDIDAIKQDLSNIGFRVDREGETWLGNKHLQLILDGENHNAEDLHTVAVKLNEISDKWYGKNIPITYNVGLTSANEITCGLDIRDKYIDGVDEELSEEDGWGETIRNELEHTFDELEALMYEVRNARRGAYAGFGDKVGDLVDELTSLSVQLRNDADKLNYIEDELNEGFPVMGYRDESSRDRNLVIEILDSIINIIEKRKTNLLLDNELNLLLKYRNLLKEIDGDYEDQIVSWDDKSGYYTGNLFTEFEELPKALDSLLSRCKGFNYILKSKIPGRDTRLEGDSVSEVEKQMKSIICAIDEIDRLYKMNDTTNESCSDKKVENNEEADNVRDEFVNQLKEALTRGSQLEKDNLSLKEQLSVCNAKELKLKNELAKYKKAVSNLSESVKCHHDLNDAIDEAIKSINSKDKLIESNKKELRVYKAKLHEATSTKESNKVIVENLNTNVKSLNEQLTKKEEDLVKLTKVVKKLKSALNESKNAYVSAQATAYGLNESTIRSWLKESFSLKDVDSVCESLLEQKWNMSKLPFRLNENTQIKFKPSTNEYIHAKNYLDDDVVSNNLLNMLDD